MKTIEIKLYSFNELSEEAKERAIEKERHNQCYLDCEWWEFVYEHHTQAIKKAGFDITRIYFSGFWSQGDGAMFEYDGLDKKLLYKAVDSLDLPKWKKAILKNGYISGKGVQSGRYCHENSCSHSIYIETDNGMQHYDNIEKLFYEYTTDIEEYIEGFYIDLCSDLYKELESEYEYLTSDESISEYLIANEFEFTVDGNIY